MRLNVRSNKPAVHSDAAVGSLEHSPFYVWLSDVAKENAFGERDTIGGLASKAVNLRLDSPFPRSIQADEIFEFAEGESERLIVENLDNIKRRLVRTRPITERSKVFILHG